MPAFAMALCVYPLTVDASSGVPSAEWQKTSDSEERASPAS
jgi:hypothetical protein